MKKSSLIIASAFALSSLGLFAYCWREIHVGAGPGEAEPSASLYKTASSTASRHQMINAILSAIQPNVAFGTARVAARSPKILAYAHGTVAADGKIFIGMADREGNPFPTNELAIFDGADIFRPTTVAVPDRGDIETMVYDKKNDEIYFLLSSNGLLKIYGLDPHTYAVQAIASTSEIDAGRKPAIVTDGAYIYGITDTDPSTVFRVGVRGGKLARSSAHHIPDGHSAGIGVYASSTELYFGGGMSNGFEKADAATLAPISSMKIEPCDMSDDMPFMKTAASSGYVYIGCEAVPYGVRVRTGDMSFERFSLPGASLGLFVYGTDLYNAAEDATIDVFPGQDLKDLHRYRLEDNASLLDIKGQSPELNEILYSPESDKLYFTAWWGVRGLYQASTSTIDSGQMKGL
jgi:hypothetical protein